MVEPTKHRTKRNKILILDGMWNKTLAVVRSFGEKGFYVTVGEWTRFATALFSKYCDRRIVYPSPILAPEKFIEWIISEIKSTGYDIVLPTELSTQMLLLKNKDEIERYTRLPFADYQLISNIQNKAWLMKFALSNNIPCPQTYFPEKEPDVGSIRDQIEYPIVIKPRCSSGSRGIVYVKKASDLLDSYRSVHSKYPDPLIQEFIPNGGAFGMGTLFNFNSEPRASFVYKRLREYPVEGGPSTLRESVENEKIMQTALSLLGLLSWKGVAMVEFRVDSRDGIPKLMEINPRFWGSLQLSILSGMDFPYLLYELAMQGDIEPKDNYKIGVKSRWLIPGDIMHFINNPDRFKILPDFFSAGVKDDILSIQDPMPTIGRISSLIPLMYKKEMRQTIF